MSLPHLLLVDDSEAILAYEKAALSGHYTLSTAINGKDALQKIYQLKPAAVLLDLSMPEMDGDEVLARIKADPEVDSIPIIVISSEKKRAEACMRGGATAYLPKPIRADELVAVVARTLEAHKQHERRGNLSVLFLGVGPLELGIPLESVHTVLLQPATLSLPAGPSYLTELFELHGQPICMLDLAHRLGVEHAEQMSERKVVVVRHGDTMLGICVDRIRDPEEFAAHEITSRTQLGGQAEGPLAEAVLAVIRTAEGPVPIIDPRALLSRGLLRKLPGLIKQVQQEQARAPRPAAETPPSSIAIQAGGNGAGVASTLAPVSRPAASAQVSAGAGAAAPAWTGATTSKPPVVNPSSPQKAPSAPPKMTAVLARPSATLAPKAAPAVPTPSKPAAAPPAAARPIPPPVAAAPSPGTTPVKSGPPTGPSRPPGSAPTATMRPTPSGPVSKPPVPQAAAGRPGAPPPATPPARLPATPGAQAKTAAPTAAKPGAPPPAVAKGPGSGKTPGANK